VLPRYPSPSTFDWIAIISDYISDQISVLRARGAPRLLSPFCVVPSGLKRTVPQTVVRAQVRLIAGVRWPIWCPRSPMS